MKGALQLRGILASSTEAVSQHLGMNRCMVFLTAMKASLIFHILSAAFSPVERLYDESRRCFLIKSKCFIGIQIPKLGYTTAPICPVF
eukprot:8058947-Ditylum_brightwellii.AAC.1